MAKAAELLIYEEGSRAPGNRTPLVKVVEVKFLVSFLIRHLSRTHIGRTDERKWQQLEREKENGL